MSEGNYKQTGAVKNLFRFFVGIIGVLMVILGSVAVLKGFAFKSFGYIHPAFQIVFWILVMLVCFGVLGAVFRKIKSIYTNPLGLNTDEDDY